MELSVPQALQFAQTHLQNREISRCEELLASVLAADPANIFASAIRSQIHREARPYQFSNKWFQIATGYWPDLFSRLGWDRRQVKSVVEIGTYEGQSTCWILENLLDHVSSKIYCIDTFRGGMEHQPTTIAELEDRFKHNISLTGKAQFVEICKGYSHDQLPALVAAGVCADFVYVDGSHKAKDVLIDAVLGWLILKPGGVMVFDDYLWPIFQENPAFTPKLAIDAFIDCMSSELTYVPTPQNYQFVITKGRQTAP